MNEGDSPGRIPGSGWVSSLDRSHDPVAASGIPQHSSSPTAPITSRRTARTTTIGTGNTTAQKKSLSIPPTDNRLAIPRRCQTSDNSGVVDKISGYSCGVNGAEARGIYAYSLVATPDAEDTDPLRRPTFPVLEASSPWWA